MRDVNSQLWTGDQRARRELFRDRADARARVSRQAWNKVGQGARVVDHAAAGSHQLVQPKRSD